MRALKKNVLVLLVTSLAGCGQQLVEFAEAGTPSSSAINLRSLSSFVAVAGAGLTSTGATTLNGNVALYPTATLTGSPTITGTLYANDPAGVASTAKADLLLAYAEAQGKPPGTIVSANLAAQTLAPGVYTSASSMDIAAGGTLTLDAKGDSNASWIFQIGSTLTANTGSKVALVNGARAANVFWAVGSSSTIGTGVDFKGTVMAVSSNSVGTSSTVEGRLLCSTGAITLQSNVITLPP